MAFHISSVVWLALLLSAQVFAIAIGGQRFSIQPYKRELLQDIVTFDEHSIFVRGQRILFYSGEFHPFRLPVPGLWLDIFQKIKSLGYSGVSFYSDWALLEGKQGNFTAEGVFAFEPFFAAAQTAGLYLLARPGPYINAEVSGGGYPGWLQRTKEVLRTPDYLKYTENYASNIGRIIAAAQITNGGPVILFQPENEYSQAKNGTYFPNPQYFAANEKLFRDAGIVVPFISNDARPQGLFAPGNGTGSVDIYGYDNYPLGFDCMNPTKWPDGALPTNFVALHKEQSPTTPNSIVEFQGGSFDPWGGATFAKCAVLLNDEFERVFYKNDFASGVTVFNQYMAFGGTNWGNLGYALGYTSYDYGAVISEDRTVVREKYSESKLLANFLQASPAYLTATTMNSSNGSYVNTAEIATTKLAGNVTNFYVIRHAAYNTYKSTNYKLNVGTSKGAISIPQLSATLTLNGRDSKISVTDYELGTAPRLIYSSADIFTWKSYDSKTVLLVYGATNETHEVAFDTDNAKIIEGSGAKVSNSANSYVIINWAISSSRQVVQVGENLLVYLLNRNQAYDFWVLNLPDAGPTGNFSNGSNTAVVVKAGYLLRTAVVEGSVLQLTGDLNRTTSIEVVGVSSSVKSLTFNGQILSTSVDSKGMLTSNLNFDKPDFKLPQLNDLSWKVLDSLPEIQAGYDDSKWTTASLTTTNNPNTLKTPVSLYGSDYGYNNGDLLFRGHFTATGAESSISLSIQGGTAFGYSVWLGQQFVGSWPGISVDMNYNQTLGLPKLNAGHEAILTFLVDNMSLDEENAVGNNTMKSPRGIINYSLVGHAQSDVQWKITGNLGGEDYEDRIRGPLNEDGLFAERQGYHLPEPPTANWSNGKPTEGISSPGVAFYTTSFDLDLPQGYDIPLSFTFANSTSSTPQQYRTLLFVNGYQFGKYINHIGPQTSFPVPEGILNYHGTNYIALTLWAQAAGGARIEGLTLETTAIIQSGYGSVELSPMPAYTPRLKAY